MAPTKFSIFLLLILSGMILFHGNKCGCMAVSACPQYCLEVAYMTCTSSGNKQLPGRCNCCFASKDCTLHLSDGSQVNCAS
ncbi:putative proteinase inhibitor I20 [Dioscorea sansibarensis]